MAAELVAQEPQKICRLTCDRSLSSHDGVVSGGELHKSLPNTNMLGRCYDIIHFCNGHNNVYSTYLTTHDYKCSGTILNEIAPRR